jgi:hypothetical protein
MTYKLLGVGTNAKTVKGDGDEYLTAILYLAPARQVDGVNLCPMAITAGCEKACLYTAGRGRFNNVQASRIKKTVLWRDNRALFLDYLRQDLTKFEAYCRRKGVTPCVRLNGTSDIRFERFGIMQDFPAIQFYDYTKDIKRAYRDMPANYHLTLSYSEANGRYAAAVLDAVRKTGINAAVVFRHRDKIPARFAGLPVLDGDQDDLRFLDKPGHVVALYAKGDAKRDATGFVIG